MGSLSVLGRLATLVALATLAVTGAGQNLQRPDVMVSAFRHPVGADMVKVRMLEPGYPLETLRAQVTEFGRRLGCAPRGLYVYGELLGPQETLETATAVFAVDGFTVPSTGAVRLAPLLQAFVAVPAKSPLKGFLVSIDKFAPTSQTVRGWTSTGVELARTDLGPDSVEFRVVVKSQKPEDIDVPDTAQAPRATVPTQPKGRPGLNPAVWGVLAAGLVLGGALVYLGLSANRSRPPE